MSRVSYLHEAVRKAYSAAAERPQGEHPFPIGQQFAESVGYIEDSLAGLPSISIDAFSGVSNVSLFADIPLGATVLDLGCGAGLDSLIASRRAGPNGKVIGIDFSDAMLARARQGATEAEAANVKFYLSDAESLPLEDSSVDVALVNGIFNLSPDRERIFLELARVIRPGGAVCAAELILREPLPQEIKDSEINWFA
jgi:arsenite methyltransferase